MGVPVIVLNSLKYFWSKKSPEEATNAAIALLEEYTAIWKKKNILLCGYSFGADVMPFIYNRLPGVLKEKVTRIQLLSPSAYTDFEIHVSYLFISKKIVSRLRLKKSISPSSAIMVKMKRKNLYKISGCQI